MKLHAIMVAALATLAACSPVPKPITQAPQTVGAVAPSTPTRIVEPASKKAIEAEAEAWVDCARTKAREMEDGRSDAATIAQAARSACRSLYRFKDDDDLGFATQIVLRSRANDPEQLTKLITPAWAICTDPFLTVEHIQQYSVDAVATVAARECKQHFQGRNGQDVQILTHVANQRLSKSTRGPVVGRPQPLPPADKRM